MLTFGPLTAFNERTSQPLPGTPIQVFTLDGALVDTFTLDGAPLVLVSNARGYVGMFQADTSERVLIARARGGNDQPVYAHETLDEAAGLAEIVESGRLSEASLMSTFVTAGQMGRRSIETLIDPDIYASGLIRIFRNGALVMISIEGLSLNASGSVDLPILPVGLRPAAIVPFNSVQYWGSDTPVSGRVHINGTLHFRAVPAINQIQVAVSYLTADPHPTPPYPGYPW